MPLLQSWKNNNVGIHFEMLNVIKLNIFFAKVIRTFERKIRLRIWFELGHFSTGHGSPLQQFCYLIIFDGINVCVNNWNCWPLRALFFLSLQVVYKNEVLRCQYFPAQHRHAIFLFIRHIFFIDEIFWKTKSKIRNFPWTYGPA